MVDLIRDSHVAEWPGDKNLKCFISFCYEFDPAKAIAAEPVSFRANIVEVRSLLLLLEARRGLPFLASRLLLSFGLKLAAPLGKERARQGHTENWSLLFSIYALLKESRSGLTSHTLDPMICIRVGHSRSGRPCWLLHW